MDAGRLSSSNELEERISHCERFFFLLFFRRSTICELRGFCLCQGWGILLSLYDWHQKTCSIFPMFWSSVTVVDQMEARLACGDLITQYG